MILFTFDYFFGNIRRKKTGFVDGFGIKYGVYFSFWGLKDLNHGHGRPLYVRLV